VARKNLAPVVKDSLKLGEKVTLHHSTKIDVTSSRYNSDHLKDRTN